jgi:hypothetical protein
MFLKYHEVRCGLEPEAHVARAKAELENATRGSLNGRIVFDYKNFPQRGSGVRWISQSGQARDGCDLTHQNGQSPHTPILHSNMQAVHHWLICNSCGAAVITKMEHWRESDSQKIRSMLSKMRMGCSVSHQRVFR